MQSHISDETYSLNCVLPASITNTGIMRLFTLNTPRSPWGDPNFGLRNLANVFPTITNTVQNENKENKIS